MKMILLVSAGTPKYYWCGKTLCHTYMARRPNIDIIVNMSLEAEENGTSIPEVDKIFSNTYYKRFKWAFLKYICEVNRPVTDYELFLTSNLGGYMGNSVRKKHDMLPKMVTLI